jgi:hypothetical protein
MTSIGKTVISAVSNTTGHGKRLMERVIVFLLCDVDAAALQDFVIAPKRHKGSEGCALLWGQRDIQAQYRRCIKRAIG